MGAEDGIGTIRRENDGVVKPVRGAVAAYKAWRSEMGFGPFDFDCIPARHQRGWNAVASAVYAEFISDRED